MAIIDKPSDYFNTVLHSGDNSSPEPISGFGFQPDWVWTKCRTAAYSHSINDSVRGANKTIRSDNTSLQVSDDAYGNLTAFNSDGFTATTGSSSINYYNQSGQTYVNWGWKAGTSFTNDASSTGIGSIDSAGSFNNDSGFSIVSYTGTGSAGTIKHGLNSVPSVIIIKVLTNTANDWCVYHQATGNNKSTFLNGTNAVSSNAFMNNTTPTSSVFSVDGSNYSSGSSRNYIAYCFADVQGYSKVGGSYVGNGSNDGSFCFTGMKPSFVMIKRTDATAYWVIIDNKRDPFNVSGHRLFPNRSDAEADETDIDFTAQGFKIRTTSATYNASGGSYIYMAFAENPFVASNFVAATAR